jgi:hypothetical protein
MPWPGRCTFKKKIQIDETEDRVRDFRCNYACLLTTHYVSTGNVPACNAMQSRALASAGWQPAGSTADPGFHMMSLCQ